MKPTPLGDNSGLRMPQIRPGVRHTWLVVALACCAAFALRVVWTIPIVFPPGADAPVDLQGVDSYVHLRVVENLVHNFPHRLTFDPYGAFPDGQQPRLGGGYDLLVGAAAWAIGGGSPSAHTIATVAAWSSPLLAMLTPIPVFLMGRLIFGSLAGVLAAWLIAVMPGSLLLLTRLGVADHHAAEIVLAAAYLYGVAKAVESGSWRVSMLAGLALGAYLGVWAMGGFLIWSVMLWAVWQSLADAVGRQNPWRVARALAPSLLVGWAVFCLFAPHRWTWLTHSTVAGGLGGLAVLGGLAWGWRRYGAPGWALPAALAAAAAMALGALATLAPERFNDLLVETGRLRPHPLKSTIIEMRPLFVQFGRFSLEPVYQHFMTTFFLGVPAIVFLLIRRNHWQRPERTLLLVWSAYIAVQTIIQARTAYYLAIGLAIVCAGALARGMTSPSRLRRWSVAAAGLFLLYLPNLPQSLLYAKANEGVPREWRRTLEWMRGNTPEPFGDPDAYYARYEPPASGERFAYPPSAYGVLNWWTSGHWITQIGRRIPVTNGFQTNAKLAAPFFAATSEDEALEHAAAVGARYVAIDAELPLRWQESDERAVGQFSSILLWTEGAAVADDYFQLLYRVGAEGSPEPQLLYRPAYYRSMATRLFFYEGEARAAGSVRAVTVENAELRGQFYRRIVEEREFETFQAAEAFAAARPDKTILVGGYDYMQPCVEIEALESFALRYRSSPPVARSPEAVKVFEIVGPAPH